jgi:hypothetical protein
MVAVLVVFSAVGSSWAAGRPGQTVTQKKVVGPYRLVLQIVPPEMMGGMGNSAACHMKGMAEVSAPSMKDCNHHVELHVYDRKTNRPVRGARVLISMRNVATHQAIDVPTMTMGTGSDFHYGNNIYAPAGTYSVQVAVNRLRASFSVRLM